MSDLTEKAAAAIVVGLLVLAPFSKPAQADFERKVAAEFQQIHDRNVSQRSWLDWAMLKGIDAVRTGHFEDGVLSSAYTVRMLGNPILHCRGALSLIWCSVPD